MYMPQTHYSDRNNSRTKSSYLIYLRATFGIFSSCRASCSHHHHNYVFSLSLHFSAYDDAMLSRYTYSVRRLKGPCLFLAGAHFFGLFILQYQFGPRSRVGWGYTQESISVAWVGLRHRIPSQDVCSILCKRVKIRRSQSILDDQMSQYIQYMYLEAFVVFFAEITQGHPFAREKPATSQMQRSLWLAKLPF